MSAVKTLCAPGILCLSCCPRLFRKKPSPLFKVRRDCLSKDKRVKPRDNVTKCFSSALDSQGRFLRRDQDAHSAGAESWTCPRRPTPLSVYPPWHRSGQGRHWHHHRSFKQRTTQPQLSKVRALHFQGQMVSVSRQLVILLFKE